MNLDTLTIKEARRALDAGEYTAVELTTAYLDAIKEKDGEIHAYLEVFGDCIEQAQAADKMIQEGNAQPLTGIPITVKDNMLIKGRRVGSASKILEGYVAPYDATAMKKLKDQGVVFLGRTNMDEFAMGSSTENSAYGVTHNPHDLTRVAGGSSGGPAAAVAAGLALGGYGSDTGGSIRQPASLCGIVGLKTTYGAVSRYGLMAMGSSLDQIGPLSKTVEDAQILFEAVRGNDVYDSTTLPDSFFDTGKKEVKTIGVPRTFLKEGVDSDVLDVFEKTLERLEKAGYTLKDVDLPNVSYSLATYYIIMPAEVSTNLARFDGIRFGASVDGETYDDVFKKTRGEGFGAEVRRRVLLGAFVLSAGYTDAYYRKATAVRELIREDFAKAFTTVDVIATPTSPTPAFKIGEKAADPLAMYAADIFTVPVNIAGIPAISVPAGTAEREGHALPVGIQFMGPHGGEEALFAMGKAFEELTN